jgi:MFS superfamily sulfate permease-like transporter
MIADTAISHFGQFHSKYGVSIVGQIKRGLPMPSLPSFNHANQLLIPAIAIAAVSLSISISMAKTLSRKHSYKVRSNQVFLRK